MLERFLSHTTPEPNTGCLLWTGAIRRGYGSFQVRNVPGLRHVRAHRVSYELFKGPIPVGHVVMHKCDVPCCVAPAHLQAGTQYENLKDMWAKGRGRWAKLTYTKAQEIRNRHAGGERQYKLAAEFGITVSTVNDIVHSKSWAIER